MTRDLEYYLAPAEGIECGHRDILALARELARGSADEAEAAGRLFDYVRDTVRYNPYTPFHRMEDYLARTVLRRGRGYCVQKSALLCALARALGIPARLGFADISNHQLPAGLYEVLGSDVMYHHCFVEWWLRGAWRKATPSFEVPLVAERGWRLVEFDPEGDCLLPETDAAGRPHISYLRYLGHSQGVPLQEILDSWRAGYGPERVDYWISQVENGGSWHPEAGK